MSRRLIVWLLATSLFACARRDAPPPPVAPEPPLEVLLEEAAAALEAAGIERLRWGVTPYLSGPEMGRRYRALIDHLAAQLGVAMEVEAGAGYADTAEGLVRGRYDIAVLSPYNYVKAKREQPDVTLVASHVAHGSTSYGSYIIARADGPVRTLADVVGRRVAFVDRRSTSGWLFPAELMLRRGIDPQTDLEATFLGGHEKAYDALADGEVDAAAVYSLELAPGRARHPDGPDVIILAKTRRIPLDAYVCRAGLPPAAARALGAMLQQVSAQTREGRRLLKSLRDINGFITVDDAHFDGVREVADRVPGPR